MTQYNQKGFSLVKTLITLGIKRQTEGDSPKYLIDNKDKNNVIMSRSEGSHNKESLHSLHSLRMIWGKGVNVFSHSKGEGVKNHFLTSLPTNLLTFKPAFTLAKTLITLGIIGVVATITVPTLIAEHQKRATVTKLQRAISVINQAYRMSYDDNGDLTAEQANNIGSKAYFDQYWSPYIKALTYCNNYKMCGYDSNQPFYRATGSKDTTEIVKENYRTTFYTADGFIYVVFNKNGVEAVLSAVMVDINGGSKPNRYGRDVFMLDRIPDGKGVQPYGYNLTDSQVNTGCKSSTTTNNSCAEKIRRAGWKIEKDYPW